MNTGTVTAVRTSENCLWLMHRRLQAAQVKMSSGVLLFVIAATMAYKLLA